MAKLPEHFRRPLRIFFRLPCFLFEMGYAFHVPSFAFSSFLKSKPIDTRQGYGACAMDDGQDYMQCRRSVLCGAADERGGFSDTPATGYKQGGSSYLRHFAC
jgi:hypothetical protein